MNAAHYEIMESTTRLRREVRPRKSIQQVIKFANLMRDQTAHSPGYLHAMMARLLGDWK